MHLLVRETRTLDEDAAASDLGQTAADIVVLSFSDADLGALAGAWQAMAGAPDLRLASLGQLRHPMSVDVYLEQVLAQARCIVIRSQRWQSTGIREFAHQAPFPRRRRDAIRDMAGASAPRAHAARFSTMAPASRRRPREIRLMTVPIGTAVISAIS